MARKPASPASDVTLVNGPARSNQRPSPRDLPPHLPAASVESAPAPPATLSFGSVQTPVQSGSGWQDFGALPSDHSHPGTAAPGRQPLYKKHANPTAKVANPAPSRPSVAPSPLAEHLARQAAAMDLNIDEDAETPGAANDSTETVTPASVQMPGPAGDVPPSPRETPSAPPPGFTVLSALRQGYAYEKLPIDLGETDDKAPKGTRELAETIRQQVTRTGHLEPLLRYFQKPISLYEMVPGLVGQLEEALENLNDIVETTYVPNDKFERFGEGQRAFRHITAWIRHTVSFVESMIELPDAADYEPPPGPLALKLRGHFHDFAQATMQGILQHPERPASDEHSPTPSQIGDANATTQANWRVQDTVAAAKILFTPQINSFYGAPYKGQARRKTFARDPQDFSRIDPLSGLLSPANKSRAPALRAGTPLQEALARARSKPAQLAPKTAMPSFLTQDATNFQTPVRPPQPPERKLSVAGSGGFQEADDPDDPDGDDNDDDDGGHPAGRHGGQGDPRRSNPPSGGRGRPPPGGHRGSGGQGDLDDDPDAAQLAAASRPRVGLTVDLRIKIDALPSWDGDEHSALKYFSLLNEWARAGLSGDLFHQLPLVAPLRWSGLVYTWWSHLSADLRTQLQQDFGSFILGIREYYLSSRWAEERRAEFVSMHFCQRGHSDETPFEYINRCVFLARVLYDLGPLKMLHEVMANTPPQWAYIIGDHNLSNTDELMTRVVQLGPSLTSAYAAGAGTDEQSVLANVEKMVEARVSSLLKSSMQQTAPRVPVTNPNNPFRHPPPSKPNRFAQLAELDQEYDTALKQPDSSLLDQEPATTPEIAGAHTALFNTVLATLSNGAKQHPRPTSYAFKESDVVSKILPPSPCKVCGSDKHWDRECGHWQSYLLRRQQNAMYSSIRSEDEECMYNEVYKVFANQAAFSSCVLDSNEKESLSRFLWSNPSVVEVEDEELEASRARSHLEGLGVLDLAADSLEVSADTSAESAPIEDGVPDVPELLEVEDSDAEDEEDEEFKLQDSLQRALFSQAMAATAHIAQEAGPPPHDRLLRDPELPTSECVLRMPKKRHPLPGQSSKGISVLSCRGRVGSLEEQLMTIRLDSCADLCLVHQKFLQSMKNPPRVRKGLKVQIAQLTSNTPEIEGYVQMHLRTGRRK
ncbi:hypothetical protein AURDEDRAFT_167762 [Auricularia subglabra TFB-10046 SS5]|nr:hypothetical protein AURDEDRAFT_167762 [Auricularia subglabra TFB-10046 SS5]